MRKVKRERGELPYHPVSEFTDKKVARAAEDKLFHRSSTDVIGTVPFNGGSVLVKRGRREMVLPRPTNGSGQTNFLRTAAQFAPKRAALRRGQKKRDRTVLDTDRAPELSYRDFCIQYDREMVKAGRKSMMVKVIKAQPIGATVAERIEADSTDVPGDIMARLKAMTGQTASE